MNRKPARIFLLVTLMAVVLFGGSLKVEAEAQTYNVLPDTFRAPARYP